MFSTVWLYEQNYCIRSAIYIILYTGCISVMYFSFLILPMIKKIISFLNFNLDENKVTNGL